MQLPAWKGLKIYFLSIHLSFFMCFFLWVALLNWVLVKQGNMFWHNWWVYAVMWVVVNVCYLTFMMWSCGIYFYREQYVQSVSLTSVPDCKVCTWDCSSGYGEVHCAVVSVDGRSVQCCCFSGWEKCIVLFSVYLLITYVMMSLGKFWKINIHTLVNVWNMCVIHYNWHGWLYIACVKVLFF